MVREQAPEQAVFDEIKAACIKIWNTYDDTYGYVTEKVGIVNNFQNIGDNAMFMFAMFDFQNQKRCRALLSNEANEYLNQWNRI